MKTLNDLNNAHKITSTILYAQELDILEVEQMEEHDLDTMIKATIRRCSEVTEVGVKALVNSATVIYMMGRAQDYKEPYTLETPVTQAQIDEVKERLNDLDFRIRLMGESCHKRTWIMRCFSAYQQVLLSRVHHAQRMLDHTEERFDYEMTPVLRILQKMIEEEKDIRGDVAMTEDNIALHSRTQDKK